MNILLTNDDGIKADGLRVLAEYLAAAGHNLLVIAPSRERSATSHAATFGKPLYLEEYRGIKNVCAWSLSGKPADCVKFGLIHRSDFKAELVISGINRGINIGSDIIYSGTVSAAQEAALLGLNAVAVSAEYVYESKTIDYTAAAGFIRDRLGFFSKHTTRDTFFNVNVPYRAAKGVKAVKHGLHRYDDKYEKHTDGKGKEYFILDGFPSGDEEDECDVKYFRQGYITVTPLFFSRTNFAKLHEMEKEQI